MLDVVRTLLLAGVGAIDLTEDKLKSVVDELTRRGELAAEEGKDLIAAWSAKARERREQLDDRVRKAVDDALARHNVALHTSVVDLETRIQALEQAVARLTEPGVEP